MTGLPFLEEGTTIAGRYRLGDRLDERGDRVIFEAHDESRGQTCRLCVMGPDAVDATRRKKLRRRVEELTGISHPQLAVPFHAGESAALDVVFVASPEIDGVPLADIKKQSGPVPPEQVVTWITSAVTALTALADAGHSHGRLASRDLLLVRSTEGVTSVVVDGLADAAAHPDPPQADVVALGRVTAELLGADAEQVKLPRAFTRWLDKTRDGGFATCREACDALGLALGVRPDIDGAMRQVVDYDEDVPLSETLRPEDLEGTAEATDSAPDEDAPVHSSIDPLGDTAAAAASMNRAADAAIAAARQTRKAPELKTHAAPETVEKAKRGVATTVDMSEEEREALLAAAGVVPRNVGWPLVVFALLMVAMAALFIFAGR